MVARVGGYYGEDFNRAGGVTQVDSLSPTILNVVVDAVVRHWVAVMVEGAEEQGDRGKEGRHHNSLLYAENVMVASLDPQWIQGAFSTPVGLFDRLVLHTHFWKTVGMVCCTCQAEVTLLEAAYRRRMMGDGPS